MWGYVAQLWAWLMGTAEPVTEKRPPKPTDEEIRNLPKMENSEVERIQKTWELVSPDPNTHGVEVLIRLFDKYPETKTLFPRLNVTSPEQMRKSPRVKAHGGRVVSSLTSIITQLDDMSLVDETIFLLGDSHLKRGVTVVEFEKFADALLIYMKEALGDVLSPETEAAFRKLMDVFNKKISQYL